MSTREDRLFNEALAWFVRLRADAVSEADRQRCAAWRRRSSAHEQAFREVCALWEEKELTVAAVQVAKATPARVPFAHRPVGIWMTASLAAFVLLAFGVARLEILTILQADYRTATNIQQSIPLPDGSTMTLNTNSAVAVDFNDTERQVRLLQGEAFFTVRAESARPFIVESHEVLARAVGTEFVVHERGSNVIVTVAQGVVEVAALEQTTPPLRLRRGQRVRIGPNGPEQVHNIAVNTALAWLGGRLVFDAARLSDVIDEVRRYYPGYVIVGNSRIGEIRVSGTYHLASPNGILEALAQTLPIRMARFTDYLVILY